MQQIAERIAARSKHGDVIGVGTGSTVVKVLQSLGPLLLSQGKAVFTLTTSMQSSLLCQSLGMIPVDPNFSGRLVFGFDGADEVDPQLRLIKGKGAAMLREKLVAAKCKEFIVVADESKLVKYLGEKCPVPIEIIPSALEYVQAALAVLGASEVKLRDGAPGKHGPVVTEFGNLVLDARFSAIPDSLEAEIKTITGVVESGLFFKIATEVLIAKKDGSIETRQR